MTPYKQPLSDSREREKNKHSFQQQEIFNKGSFSECFLDTLIIKKCNSPSSKLDLVSQGDTD